MAEWHWVLNRSTYEFVRFKWTSNADNNSDIRKEKKNKPERFLKQLHPIVTKKPHEYPYECVFFL